MERKRHLKIGIPSYTDAHTVLGVTGNTEFSGIVTALEFHGDGSNLTNITADAGAYAGSAGFATVAGYAHTAGIATVAEGLTGRPDIEINNLDVAGVTTHQGDIYLGDSDVLRFGTGSSGFGDLQIWHDGSHSYVRDNGTGNLRLKTNNMVELVFGGTNEVMGQFIGNAGVGLYYNSNKKFETTGVGATVFGTTQTQQLNVSGVSTFNDDVKVYTSNLNVYGGYGQFGNVQIGAGNDRTIRTSTGNLILESNSHQVEIQDDVIVSGIVTANGFVGPLEGNVTGDLTGDVNAGVITAVSGNFTGNVTIGGTLTYEDVTNVDSIGIVTARDGIVVNTRGIHVLSGITTLQDLDAQDLNIRNITGSAATFTDSVSLYDNDKIFLGTSQEMEIFHGTLGNSFFISTKPLYIKYGAAGQTHEMFIQNDSTTAAKFTDDASVELYYNGGKRLETVGGGVTVTGDLRVSGVVTATRFESTSSGTPSIDSPNNLDLNAINVAVSTDMSVGRNLTVVGFVSAANFYGDGSGLTNLPSSSYAPNAGVATYAQTAGIATLAENLTGSPAITISSATVGSNLNITASNIYRSNADLTLGGGGPQSTRSQLILSNGSSATLKAHDSSGSVVLKAPVGSVQVLDVGVTTSTPFVRTGAAGTVRLDRGDGNFTGVVTATTFYGDFQGTGSGITGITATYAATAGVSSLSNASQGLTGTPDIFIDDLYVTGVSTFRDAVLINRNTTNEGIRFEFNGGYKGGLTAASNEFRVTSNGSKDLLLGCNNAGGTNGDVVIATAGISGSYSTGWGRMAVFGGTGTAELYYQDVKKFETTASGIDVTGHTETDTLNVSGVSTFSKISVGNTTGTDGQYLKSTGVGVTWADFPVVRTGLSTVATSGQTGFTTSYNVGFVDVYVNGIRLTNSEFTATDGSNIGLTTACFGGEYVDIIAYNTISTGTGGGGGGGGSSATRSSETLTISSIASGVTTTGTVTLPKSGVMISIHPVGDASGWLRLYTRSDLATADASRTRTEDPGSGSGVILETITSGINTVYLSPQTIFANAEDTPINTFNYRFTKDGSAGITTFTFKYLSLEP